MGNGASLIFIENWETEVSRGNLPGHFRVNKAGYNSDIDTLSQPEDMWDVGGIQIPPTVARIHNIKSGSILDTSAGTGARTIIIQGLDASYNYITETVSLNGILNVPTLNAYIMIDYMFVATAGTLSTAQGIINATAQTDNTITAQINLGNNQTHAAIYQIRDGHKGYLNRMNCSMSQATAGSSSVIYLMTKTLNGVWLVRRVIYLNNSGNSHQSTKFFPPIEFQAKTLIKLQIFSVSNNNTSVEGGFDLVLIKD